MERRGDFLTNFARPTSSESPVKYKSASLLFNCQLGNQFRCAQWSLFRLWQLKNSEMPVQMPVRRSLCNLQGCGVFFAAFTSEKRWMMIKKIPNIWRAVTGWGTGGFLYKNLRAFLFKEDLSNEPNFGRIHLVGQHLNLLKPTYILYKNTQYWYMISLPNG